MTSLIRAHGLGGRSDLPPDAKMAAIGAAISVAVTFLIAVVAMPQRERAGTPKRQPLARLGRLIDSAVVVSILRSLAFAAAALTVAVALFGPAESRFNLAPYVVYVIFWVGLAFASVLFGPVWPRVNPLRSVHSLLCRLVDRSPDDALFRLPPKVGVWPAAMALLVFVWLELVYPQRAQPYVVGVFLTAYSVIMVFCALAFGRRWFAAGDAFELYSRLFGSLAVVGRRADGQLVLRSPLHGLRTVLPLPGLAAAVVVLIGSTGFDGLTRTSWWQRSVPPDSVPLGTAGLLALVAAVGALYVGAITISARVAREHADDARRTPSLLRRKALVRLFAHSLVPIALGYTVAHYFSFFLFQGQTAIALISDPFGRGWDLFGTADRAIKYTFIGSTAIAQVQVYAIVLGHVCGVIAAHDRALALMTPAVARRSQYPLAIVMVGITLCGVLLLLSG